jgi:hypothetical protein
MAKKISCGGVKDIKQQKLILGLMGIAKSIIAL